MCGGVKAPVAEALRHPADSIIDIAKQPQQHSSKSHCSYSTYIASLCASFPSQTSFAPSTPLPTQQAPLSDPPPQAASAAPFTRLLSAQSYIDPCQIFPSWVRYSDRDHQATWPTIQTILFRSQRASGRRSYRLVRLRLHIMKTVHMLTADCRTIPHPPEEGHRDARLRRIR